MKKVITAAEAAALIRDGDVVSISSSSGLGCPDKVLAAIGERFDREDAPRNLTTLNPINVFAAWNTDKAKFTLDTDGIALPERLLTLGLIWRWRSQKRMEYSEDMANFEIAKAEEITNDKGRRPIIVGAQRMPVGGELAYPGVLGH